MAEEGVEPSGLEDCSVAEFVHPVDRESADHSIEKHDSDRRPPGPVIEGEPCRDTRPDQDG